MTDPIVLKSRQEAEKKAQYYSDKIKELAERETKCLIKEREISEKENALLKWGGNLKKREEELETRKASLTPAIPAPEVDPLRVGDVVKQPNKNLIGKVTRVVRIEKGMTYNVVWAGNKSGTYARKELERA